MKWFSVLILLLNLLSCKDNEKQIDPNKVIIEAIYLSYNELKLEEREGLKNYYTDCCCYPDNWNKGVDCIKKENAHYVKSNININLLAKLLESSTFKIDQLISPNPHSLYGKYHNRWKFFDEFGNEICETSKFEGHNSFNLIRKDSIDELIIGPLPVKPKEMIIKIVDSKYYAGLTPKKTVN